MVARREEKRAGEREQESRTEQNRKQARRERGLARIDISRDVVCACARVQQPAGPACRLRGKGCDELFFFARRRCLGVCVHV